MKINGTETNAGLLRELGRRIADTRIACSMTRAELAERAGTSVKTLQRLEEGENVRVEAYLSAFRALGILGNLEAVIPQQEEKPSDLLRYGHRRKRASGKKPQQSGGFQWGDEK
ncbi:MAG: helix-turn-helix domain-containing protein [Lachnospiraceae bacterium]|nr:helix-turn-helix domain-containing protein [Lachnospiraceae bacterium]